MKSSRDNPTVPVGQRAWHGAVAGTLATAPMSLFMFATRRFLPKEHRYDLPPEIITKELAHRAHIKPFWGEKEVHAATTLSHFGYGSIMGSFYRLLYRRPFAGAYRYLRASLQGVLFGVGVWAASYLGLLPLLKMRAAGTREPGHRNLMMIAAHVVWGASMGGISEFRMAKQGQ